MYHWLVTSSPDVELSTAAEKISTHLQYVVDMVCEEEEERHGSMVRGFSIEQPFLH